jgi:hypothetical protein
MDKALLMGITTYRQIPAVCFAHHLTSLIDAAKFGYVKRIEVEHDIYITMARNKICNNALELWKNKEITHLLFVDDDVLVPLGGIRQLVDTNLPVVSGLYFTRDFTPCAYELVPKFRNIQEVPETGIFQVDAAGAGVLLIECSILQQMVDKYDNRWWFQNTIEAEPDTGEERYLGEDIFFFRRLKEMGIPVAINCDVHCDHVSTSITNLSTYKMKRQQEKSQQ